MSVCPVCDTPGLQPFIVFDDVPVSGLFGDGPAAPIPHRRLAFDYCPCCCLVTQQPEPQRAIDYSGVARATARQLPNYAAAMIERLVAVGVASQVIEVGCNDGTFLNALRAAGFTRLLGVEPSQALAAHVAALGHAVIQQPLDTVLADEIAAEQGPADIIVCRHTLEHVPSPLSFLRALRRLLRPGGLACIEVPSLRPVIDALHIHEIWDEHISYFLPETLRFALERAGFHISEIRVEPYREMQNIVVWAKAAETATLPPPLPPLQDEAALCASFGQRWQQRRDSIRAMIEASPAPRVAMGASHPQTNFLNFSGLASLVDCVIDDDPHKQGRWLPLGGRCVPIHPSSELPARVAGATLLLTGFGYPQWMASAQGAATDARCVIDVAAALLDAKGSP